MFTIRLHVFDYVLRMFWMQGKKFFEQHDFSRCDLELRAQSIDTGLSVLKESLDLTSSHGGFVS